MQTRQLKSERELISDYLEMCFIKRQTALYSVMNNILGIHRDVQGRDRSILASALRFCKDYRKMKFVNVIGLGYDPVKNSLVASVSLEESKKRAAFDQRRLREDLSIVDPTRLNKPESQKAFIEASLHLVSKEKLTEHLSSPALIQGINNPKLLASISNGSREHLSEAMEAVLSFF